MSETIDTREIADMLGLSREYVTDRLTKRPDFPKPVMNRSQRMRRWVRADVMKWAFGENAKRVEHAA